MVINKMTKYIIDIPDIITSRIIDNENEPELEIIEGLAEWYSNMFGSNWVNSWKSEIKVKEIKE